MKVFVYGTLKKGYRNNVWLTYNGAKYIKQDSIKGTMYSLGSFPVVDIKGNGKVVGEVYEIDKECERSLDLLENYPSLYDKTVTTTVDGVTALVYHMSYKTIMKYDNKEIKTGEWF